ncbi:MAG: hypothetical protein M5R36_19435 [Deltaproteobacteria bacterium]|nr:hypothetical protein [Deltaproteobacteria bacterium]
MAATDDAAVKGIVAETLAPRTAGVAPANEQADALLEIAVAAYREAARRNAVDADARFWETAARAELGELSAGDSIGRLRTIIELDPMRPDLWRAAGDHALRAGFEGDAAAFYEKALRLSYDGLEEIVAVLVNTRSGVEAAVAVVPDDPRAQHRLSAALFDAWHFTEAEDAWRRYRTGAKLPIVERRSGELVTNAFFRDQLGSGFHDWTIVPAKGVKVSDPGKADGLEIAFSPGPASYFHLQQDIPVAAGSASILSADFRLEPADTPVKIGIEAVHPMGPELFAAGDSCYVRRRGLKAEGRSCDIGAEGEVRLRAVVHVPSVLPLIRVRVTRAAQDGETGVSGTMRISHVSLKPMASDE